MAKGDIKVSEKHGVNPSMEVCFWCGEHTGNLLMLGRLPGDVEAPREMVTSYQPCDCCLENFTQGIHVFEMTDRPTKGDKQLDLQGRYPTGRYCVVKEEAIALWINDKEIVQSVLEQRKCGVPPEVFNSWFASVIKTPEAEAQMH